MSGLHDPKSISIQSFRYDLPEELIARKPLAVRDQSKLLVYKNHQITDSRFHQLDNYLNPGDFLIFNQTKVIQARILFQKSSGSTIEIMCLEPHGVTETNLAFQLKGSCEWVALVGNAKRWKEPSLSKTIAHEKGNFELFAEQVERQAGSYIIRFRWNADLSFAEVIEAAGKIPLPPYLNREPDEDDLERYQTVYALEKGSVAAPTAGLHFTENTFEKVKKKNISHAFVTLHVGAGTFKPVKSETMLDHEMHQERVYIKLEVIQKILLALTKNNRVITVGTTSLRTIESLYWFGIGLMSERNINREEMEIGQWEPYESTENSLPSVLEALTKITEWMQERNLSILSGYTRILIAPGYDFKIVSGLITNFHQPESTLLLLVSAFIGEDWRKVYKHALENDYRFLSYGDSSILFRE